MYMHRFFCNSVVELPVTITETGNVDIGGQLGSLHLLWEKNWKENSLPPPTISQQYKHTAVGEHLNQDWSGVDVLRALFTCFWWSSLTNRRSRPWALSLSISLYRICTAVVLYLATCFFFLYRTGIISLPPGSLECSVVKLRCLWDALREECQVMHLMLSHWLCSFIFCQWLCMCNAHVLYLL